LPMARETETEDISMYDRSSPQQSTIFADIKVKVNEMTLTRSSP
jgi:hypothetical protein